MGESDIGITIPLILNKCFPYLIYNNFEKLYRVTNTNLCVYMLVSFTQRRHPHR